MRRMIPRLAMAALAMGAAAGTAGAQGMPGQGMPGQGTAIAVPPPPPVASVPAQPLMPPRVIVPGSPPPPGLVPPSAGPPGGAVPILEPESPPRYTPSPTPVQTPPQPPPDHQAAANPASAAAQPPPVAWLPRRQALLGVLNKEDGSVSRLAVQVGNSAVQGKLAVKVLACLVRPNTAAPDAAVFLSVKTIHKNQQDTGDSSSGAGNSPLFRGWLLHSEPGASVVSDATDTFRLIGCRT